MTDVEYILKQDAKSKKSAGRGIYAKKGGSKSKKCSLPSDNLSKKELKKMNGELKMYNLSKPMSYSVFCSMPVDLRIEYLKKLRDEYGASLSDIATMMHVKTETLAAHKQRLLDGKPGFKSYKNSRLDGLAWARFLTQDCDKPKEETNDIPEPVTVEVEAPKLSIIDGGCLTLNGTPKDILRTLESILDADGQYKVVFEFSKTIPMGEVIRSDI